MGMLFGTPLTTASLPLLSPAEEVPRPVRIPPHLPVLFELPSLPRDGPGWPEKCAGRDTVSPYVVAPEASLSHAAGDLLDFPYSPNIFPLVLNCNPLPRFLVGRSKISCSCKLHAARAWYKGILALTVPMCIEGQE